jgi:hypothetical protein
MEARRETRLRHWLLQQMEKEDPIGQKVVSLLNWDLCYTMMILNYDEFNNSQEDFHTIIDMPVGTHNFKFIVDDEWKCSEDLPTASDPEGNLINYLQVSKEASHAQGDGLDDLTLNDLDMTRGKKNY